MSETGTSRTTSSFPWLLTSPLKEKNRIRLTLSFHVLASFGRRSFALLLDYCGFFELCCHVVYCVCQFDYYLSVTEWMNWINRIANEINCCFASWILVDKHIGFESWLQVAWRKQSQEIDHNRFTMLLDWLLFVRETLLTGLEALPKP